MSIQSPKYTLLHRKCVTPEHLRVKFLCSKKNLTPERKTTDATAMTV